MDEVVTFRLSPEMISWLAEYREQFKGCPDNPAKPEDPIRVSILIRELLEGIKSRRLVMLSEPVSFSPSDEPLQVCLNPRS